MIIEPFAGQDCTDFLCGATDLDNYIRYQAGQDLRRHVVAPFVLLDDYRKVVGYYTLSAYSVVASELPVAIYKKMPRYPLLPATLLGRLAIHRDHQGENIGQKVLLDALWRSWKNTKQIGSIGVVAEAINDAASAFYRHNEFLPLQDHPRKLFIMMKTIKNAFR